MICCSCWCFLLLLLICCLCFCLADVVVSLFFISCLFCGWYLLIVVDCCCSSAPFCGCRGCFGAFVFVLRVLFLLVCVSLASDTPKKHHFPAISQGFAPFVSQNPFLQHPSFWHALCFSSFFWLVFFFFFWFYFFFLFVLFFLLCSLLLCFFICFFWLLFLLLIFPFLFIFLFFWCLFLFGSCCVESCHSAVSSSSSSSSFSYFSAFSSLSSGSDSPSDSRMHAFLALPCCLGSWAACCGGSVLCVSVVFGHPTGVPAFFRVKNAAIFRPMFSSILGGGGRGSSLSWEVKKGNLVPPCRCLSSSFLVHGEENTRNIVVSGVNSKSADRRVNGAFACSGKNGQKTLQK